MVERGYDLNDRIYSSLLQGFVLSHKGIDKSDVSSVSDIALRETDPECISELISVVEQLGGSPSGLYIFVVTRLCKEGRTDESKDLVQTRLKSGVYLEKAIDIIIECYCRKQKHTKCLELIRLVVKSGFVPSFKSLCLVIQGLKKEGDTERARELVMELVSSNGVVERTGVLPYVECIMEGDETGDCSEVIDLVEQLQYRERPIF